MHQHEADKNILQVSAGVIVDESGRVLLCQRGYGPQKGQWEFPGGKREAGESNVDCLIREISEELGMRVVCEEELLCMRYAYPDKTIDFCFLLARMQEKGMQVREHSSALWLKWEEIGAYPLCPADAEAYRKMCKRMTK